MICRHALTVHAERNNYCTVASVTVVMWTLNFQLSRRRLNILVLSSYYDTHKTTVSVAEEMLSSHKPISNKIIILTMNYLLFCHTTCMYYTVTMIITVTNQLSFTQKVAVYTSTGISAAVIITLFGLTASLVAIVLIPLILFRCMVYYS